jgi:hypothetical protein
MSITITISGENAAEVQAQLRDAAATFSAARTLEVATPVAAPAAPADDEGGEGEAVDVNTPDARGYTWDARIHSSNQKRVAKTNTWQLRRNVDTKLVAQVEAEQDALRAPVAAVAAPVAAVAAPVAAVAAVVPPPPPAAEPTAEELAAAFAADAAAVPPPPPAAPATPEVNTADLFKQAMVRVGTAKQANKITPQEAQAAAIAAGAPMGLPGLASNHAAALAFIAWLDGKGL